MVSQITAIGRDQDRRGEPWRRRNAYPVLILVIVLAVAGVITWGVALSRRTEAAAPVTCPTPAAPASASAAPRPGAAGATTAKAPASTRFDVVPPGDMVSVKPAPLANTNVRVLNASDQNGRAQEVLAKLKDYGFTTPATGGYGDDTHYNHDMACQAQVRFGDAGKTAAAGVWIAAPCAQLINDGRKDNSVDLVIGTYFNGIDPSADAQEVLRTLRAAAAGAPDGGANPALIAAVHNQNCS
ncbi:envelope integrity protein Cei [Tsukamurella sp. 8F]|uniref:envelope integrity protein Cei n=1 Tax=unclassified Tsukamurella TaxID=2633480 RepID=UPI0023BA2EE9|nr:MULTISPECIES: envelope integrity protein Cei [unclassified Tsukamurella]MDF0531300.1 envelope integrity protein Cei [Tsukamurella sp. 8J]MDF0585249.1 envelope integrity protein Cei [Tsukamurella sp. 8F]